MVSSPEERAHESATAVTDTVHDNSWSANLEQPEHAETESTVIKGAISAIEHTTSGNHVNLVTHANHGHPNDYLTDVLEERVEEAIEMEYVDQCGCGGYVLRVHVG
jgi:putative CGCGG family rSAM target protein